MKYVHAFLQGQKVTFMLFQLQTVSCILVQLSKLFVCFLGPAMIMYASSGLESFMHLSKAVNIDVNAFSWPQITQMLYQVQKV